MTVEKVQHDTSTSLRLSPPPQLWQESNQSNRKKEWASTSSAPNTSIPEPVEAVPEPVEAVPEPVEAVPEPVEAVPEPVEAVPEPVEGTTTPCSIQYDNNGCIVSHN